LSQKTENPSLICLGSSKTQSQKGEVFPPGTCIRKRNLFQSPSA
jgi:hypothetical protein